MKNILIAFLLLFTVKIFAASPTLAGTNTYAPTAQNFFANMVNITNGAVVYSFDSQGRFTMTNTINGAYSIQGTNAHYKSVDQYGNLREWTTNRFTVQISVGGVSKTLIFSNDVLMVDNFSGTFNGNLSGNAATATTASNSPFGAFGTMALEDTNSYAPLISIGNQWVVLRPQDPTVVLFDNNTYQPAGDYLLRSGTNGFTGTSNSFSGTFTGNGSGLSLSGTNIAAAGGITNGRPNANLPAAIITSSANLSGILRQKMFQEMFAAADSQTVKAEGIGTGTTYYPANYGGATNASTPSAVTNQPDGTILYTGTTFASNNVSWAYIFTNSITPRYVTNLDTAISYPGQMAGNIWGGYSATNCYHFAQDPRGNSYASDGHVVIASLMGGGPNDETCSWYWGPNDISITFLNASGNTVTYLTNSGPYPLLLTNISSSFRTCTATGVPNTLVTFVIGTGLYPGEQYTFAAPYNLSANHNQGTNNIPTGSWVDTNIVRHAFQNPPWRVSVFEFAGNNEIAKGYLTNAFQMHFCQSNKVAYFAHIKQFAASNGVVAYCYLVTTPYAPSFGSGANSNLLSILHADELTTPASVCDGIIDLYGMAKANGVDHNAAAYMDSTHPLTNLASMWGLFANTNLDLSSLPPTNPSLLAGNASSLTNFPAAGIATNGSITGQVLTSLGGVTLWTNVPASAPQNTNNVTLTGLTTLTNQQAAGVLYGTGTNFSIVTYSTNASGVFLTNYVMLGNNLTGNLIRFVGTNSTTLGKLDQLGNLTIAGQYIGDASALTNMNASQLTSGTVADARLSANVALLNGIISNNVSTTAIGSLVTVNTSSASSFNTMTALVPNIPIGSETYMSFGKSGSTKNWGGFGFHYTGNGSDGNWVGLSFYGTSDYFTLNADGTETNNGNVFFRQNINAATNTAAYFTITNTPSVALATSWTNPCSGRIQLIVAGTLNMAVAGSTTLTFTNLTTAEGYIVAGSTVSIAGTSYFTDKELLSPGDVIQYIAANTGTATTTLTGTTIKKQ